MEPLLVENHHEGVEEAGGVDHEGHRPAEEGQQLQGLRLLLEHRQRRARDKLVPRVNVPCWKY